MKSLSKLQPPCISNTNEFISYANALFSRYNPKIFTGHLELLENPYLTTHKYPLENNNDYFKFFINTKVGEDWYKSPASVFNEFNLFQKIGIISEGDVIFDCGAHQGMYSIIFASMVGKKGSVIAFELVPFNAELARLNLNINNIENATVFDIGLSDTDQIILSSPQSHSMMPASSDDKECMSLKRLDEFIEYNPTVIKMDIEGAEINALSGATGIINRRAKWIISMHPQFIKNFAHEPKEVFNFLPLDDYKCFIKYPGMDLIEYTGQFPIEDFCELAFLPK
jgi:FkbM family methyltransferase